MPAWRHALINYPHPLLKRGLVVIDTPGLNAIGAEPELTLGLLPSAHATVFILGADTGVTKSDLEIWREHLDGRALERFVVLNKIDTLADPLSSREEVEQQVLHQCDVVAQTLAVPRARVFPLSARDALAARVAGNDAALQTSRLPALEEALSAQLMPQRSAVIGRIAVDGMEALRQQAARRLGDQRRQQTEQLLELRSLRGKSGSKVKLMLERAQADSAEFERCTVRLSALKAVHARQLKQVMQLLSSDRVRDEVGQMRKTQRRQLVQARLAQGLRRLVRAAARDDGAGHAEGRRDRADAHRHASSSSTPSTALRWRWRRCPAWTATSASWR